MNLMHLRYFCKLAETQHYTQAASELYISQPGLSGAITSLERELGVSLFQKRGRNVVLTKHGKEFYDYVKKSLRILDTGIAVANEHSGKLTGNICIASITTIDDSLLPIIVTEFKKKYPLISFRFIQGQTEQIVDGILHGDYDIGFCTFTSGKPHILAIPVLAQRVVAVVHKAHPLAKKSSIKLSDLIDYDIYSYSDEQPIGEQMKILMKEYCPEFPLKKLHLVLHNEIFLAGLLIQFQINNQGLNNVGLAINAPHLNEFRDLSIIPISDVPDDYHEVCMVFNPEGNHPYAATLFSEFVRDNFSLS